MIKISKIILCVAFVGIIFFFGCFTITNNNTKSDVENRTLTTFPKLSRTGLLNGTYTDELTEAFSDQLALRNELVQAYYYLQFTPYKGDVAVGKNNELYAAYQRVSDLDAYEDDMTEVVPLINEVADDVAANGGKFVFLSIPRKDAIETENLPDSYIASTYIYEDGIDIIKSGIDGQVILIDGYELLSQSKEATGLRCYYTTDHHITPRAAELLYNAFVYAIDDARVKPLSLEDVYEIGTTVVDGAFSKQIGQTVVGDEEELYLIPKFDLDYKIYDENGEVDWTIWGEGDTFAQCYMGGDHAFTLVDTNRSELPNILIVGSSFTNIFEALAVHDFNKMVSVDYRHNESGTSIADYVEQYDIDYVLYIPSQSDNALKASNISMHLGY